MESLISERLYTNTYVITRTNARAYKHINRNTYDSRKRYCITINNTKKYFATHEKDKR